MEAGTRRAQNDRLRMLGPPPPNGAVNKRNVNESEYSKKRAKQCAAVGLFDQRAQEQVGNVEQPQNEGGSKPRIPGPPDAPHGMRPDGAGDQHDRCEGKADFGGGNSEPIPARLAAKDAMQIGDEADEKRNEGGPSSWDLKIERARK